MKKLALPICLLFGFQAYAASVCSDVSSSGIYSYGGSIEAEPTETDDAAICINASDVIVDLGGYVYGQLLSNRWGGFTGIKIASGLKNVTIKNGTIQNVTGYGIWVGAGCQDILFEDVTVNSCDKAGMFFDGNTSDHITHVVMNDCTILSCTGAEGQPAYGLRMVYADNVVINNGVFNTNDAATTNVGYGASVEWCSAVVLKNCIAHANGGSTLGVGLHLYNSDWVTIKDGSFVNNISRSGSTSRAIGCLLDTAEHCTLLNCIAKHNNNSLAEAYGFQCLNGSDNQFEKCIAKQNVGGSKAAGFYFKTNEAYSSLLKSEARLNNGGASGTGYGLLLEGAQNCDILGNKFIRNIGSVAYGLKDTVVDTTNLTAGNISYQNTTTGFDVSRTVGSFPVVTASVGDFSALTTNNYLNIHFTE